jgi:hypothetical protein
MGTTGNEGFSPSAIPGVGYPVFQSLQGGIQVPMGGRLAAFVHADGWKDALGGICSPIDVVKTMNEALGRCRPNYPDTVFVLPGHEELVAAADSWSNLVAGTRIVGLGHGSLRPTFTWSDAAGSVLINVANVQMRNLHLEMAGDPDSVAALTVAAPMTVSAAHFLMESCTCHTEIDADQAATIAITTTAAADYMVMNNVHMYAAAGDGTLPTTQLRLVGADYFKAYNCIFEAFTSSVNVGPVQMLTTASLGVHFDHCKFIHRTAASVSPVVGHAGSIGWVTDCDFYKLADDDLTLAKVWLNPTLMQFSGCRICNVATENAGIATTVST